MFALVKLLELTKAVELKVKFYHLWKQLFGVRERNKGRERERECVGVCVGACEREGKKEGEDRSTKKASECE